MKKETKTIEVYSRDPFGNVTDPDPDYYEVNTYTGTLEEIAEAVADNGGVGVTLERNEKTEHLFEAWDNESRFVMVDGKCEPLAYDDTLGKYDHVFIVE